MSIIDDDDIIVIQALNEIEDECKGSVRCQLVSNGNSDNTDSEENTEQPIVMDVYSITNDDFIQIDDDSDDNHIDQKSECASHATFDQSPRQKSEWQSDPLARLEALEQRQLQNNTTIDTLQNELAASQRIVKKLKRRVNELERNRRPVKRCKLSNDYSGKSTSSTNEDTEDLGASEIEYDTWLFGSNKQTPEEIVVTPTVRDLSQLNQSESEVSSTLEPKRRQLPADLKITIDRFKEFISFRGVTYGDVTKWSTGRYDSVNPGKISLFFNKKLDEAKSREMVSVFEAFFSSLMKPPVDLTDAPDLPENLAFEIDKNIDRMSSSGLNGDDFISWTKLAFGVQISKSHVRHFKEKRLDEEESHKMVALFKNFLNEKTSNHPRQRKPSFKQRFSEDQLQILKKALKDNPFPTKIDVEELAAKLNTTWTRVKNWFMNRRQERRLRARAMQRK